MNTDTLISRPLFRVQLQKNCLFLQPYYYFLMAKQSKPRRTKKKIDESALLAELAIKGIQEKKGKEIISFDLRNISNGVCDYFVVCHAESTTQVAAIARSVDEVVFKSTKEHPWCSEGFENAEWILLDFVTVVVHVFREDRRRFYNLERLWADANMVKIAGNY